MEKIKFKLFLSIIFSINVGVIVFFFKDIAVEYESLFLLAFFIYFLADSLTVIVPYMNDAVFSGKQFKKFFKEVPAFSKERFTSIVNKNNRIALYIFIIYFGMLTVLGVVSLSTEAVSRFHLYFIFFLLNTSDYICILVWCPFRKLFLKNKCCNTCRISNWDRLMKFYILIFVASVYTYILFVLGLIVFLLWEYFHFKHPERFYSISNKTLSCKECTDIMCKNKE